MALAADRDGFDVLGAEHGAQPTASGVAPVVRDRGEPYAAFSGRANHGAAKAAAQLLPQAIFGGEHSHSPEFAGRLDLDTRSVDQQDRGSRGPAADQNRIDAGALAGQGEAAAGQRIVVTVGQGALAHDGELGRGRDRAADEWTEHERDGCVGRERIEGRLPGVQEQVDAQACAAQESSQYIFRQGVQSCRCRDRSTCRYCPW